GHGFRHDALTSPVTGGAHRVAPRAGAGAGGPHGALEHGFVHDALADGRRSNAAIWSAHCFKTFAMALSGGSPSLKSIVRVAAGCINDRPISVSGRARIKSLNSTPTPR